MFCVFFFTFVYFSDVITFPGKVEEAVSLFEEWRIAVPPNTIIISNLIKGRIRFVITKRPAVSVCANWFKYFFLEFVSKIFRVKNIFNRISKALRHKAMPSVPWTAGGIQTSWAWEELVASTIWLSWRTIVAWIHIVWNLISDLTFGHGKDTGPQPMQTEDWRCSRTAVAKFRSFWEYDRCLVFLKVLLLVLEHLAHRRRLL